MPKAAQNNNDELFDAQTTSNVAQQLSENANDVKKQTAAELDAAPQVFHRKSERRRIARDIFFVLEEQPNRRRGRGGRGRGSRGGATHKSKFGYLKVDTNHTNAGSSSSSSKRGGRAAGNRQMKHEKLNNLADLKSSNEAAVLSEKLPIIETSNIENVATKTNEIVENSEPAATIIAENNNNNNVIDNEKTVTETENLVSAAATATIETANVKRKNDLWALVEFSRVETVTPNNSPRLRLEYDGQNDDDDIYTIHDANIEMAPASAPAATLRMTPERIIVTPTYSECSDADTITICNFKEDCNFKISSSLRAKIAAVNPIFLWVRQSETRIVEVRCEDYDQRNRLRLTKTRHGWRAMPRTDPCTSKIIKFARCQHVKPPLMKIKNELLALHEQRKKCKQALGEAELMLYTANKTANGALTTHICTDISFNDSGLDKNLHDNDDDAVQQKIPNNFQQQYKTFSNAYKTRKRLRRCSFSSMRKRKRNFNRAKLNLGIEETANCAFADNEQLAETTTTTATTTTTEMPNFKPTTSLTAEEDQLLNDLVAVTHLVEQPAIANVVSDDGESINETSKNLKDLLDDHGLLLLQNYADSVASDVEFIESLVKRSCDADADSVNATVDIVAALDDDARLTLALTPQLDNQANIINNNNNNDIDKINDDVVIKEQQQQQQQQQLEMQIKGLEQQLESACLHLQPQQQQQPQEQLQIQNKQAQIITEQQNTQNTNTTTNTKQKHELSTENVDNFIYKLHGNIGNETINANTVSILINDNDNADDEHDDATTTTTTTAAETTTTKASSLEKSESECEEPLKKRACIPTTTTTATTNDEKPDPDALTQLHLLLTNTEWSVPDPILVPKDRLDAVLESPAREIPLLLTTRRDLKLPQAFATTKIIYNANILVVSMYQLEAILKGELHKTDLINSCDLFSKYKNCTPEEIIAIMMASQQRPSCLIQQQQQQQQQQVKIVTTITATTATETASTSSSNLTSLLTTTTTTPASTTKTTTISIANSVATTSARAVVAAAAAAPAVALPSLVISSPVTPSSSLSSPMLPSPVLPPPPPPPLLAGMRLTTSPQHLHTHQHKPHRRAIAAAATMHPPRRHTVSLERDTNQNQVNTFHPHLYLQHNRVDPYQRITQPHQQQQQQSQQQHEPLFNLQHLQENMQQQQEQQKEQKQQNKDKNDEKQAKQQQQQQQQQSTALIKIPTTTTTITTTTTAMLVTSCATGAIATLVATRTTAAATTTTTIASALTTTAAITASAALTEQIFNFPVPPLWFLSHLLQLINANESNPTGAPIITPLMMHIALQRHQHQLHLQVQQYNQIMLWYEQRKSEMLHDKPSSDMAGLPPLSLADLTALFSYYMPPNPIEQALYHRILRDQFGTIFLENVNAQNELLINQALSSLPAARRRTRKSSNNSSSSLDSIASSSSSSTNNNSNSNSANNSNDNSAVNFLPPPPPRPASQTNLAQLMHAATGTNEAHDSIAEELQRIKAAMAETANAANNNEHRPRLSCRAVEELLEKKNTPEQNTKNNKQKTDAAMQFLPEWQQLINNSNPANSNRNAANNMDNMEYTRAHRRSISYATADAALMQPPALPAQTTDRNVNAMRAPMRRASVDSIALENNQWQHSCNSQDTTGYPSQWNWTTVTATGE